MTQPAKTYLANNHISHKPKYVLFVPKVKQSNAELVHRDKMCGAPV